MPLVTGKSGFSSALPRSSSSLRVRICVWPVRLRVICRKLANLTLSVTVRPRLPERSQCSQTLLMMSCSAACAAS